jgi:serine/threonine protein kinase
LKKGQTITPKNDIFSAGAIFQVLLTGKYLFDGKTPKDVFESNKNMAFDL